MDLLDDDEPAAVLAAALALIDECFDSANGERVIGHRRVCFIEELTKLQKTIDQLRVACERSPRADTASLWACIAINQLALRVDAVRENLLLRRVVRTQWRQAWQLVDIPASLLRPSPALECSASAFSHHPLEDESLRVLLRAKLDKVMATGSCGQRPLPMGEAIRKRVAQMDATGYGMKVQLLDVRRYPFKLSLVADVGWRVLVHDLCGQVVSGEEVFGQYCYRRVSSVEFLEARLVCGVRRVFTSDGRVVLAMASIAVPLNFDGSNVHAGVEAHEISCWRLSRAPGSSSVLSEMISEIDLSAVDGASPSRLERFEEFETRRLRQSNNSGLQRLENGFIDESLRRSRTTRW